jgi:hypothetical protein
MDVVEKASELAHKDLRQMVENELELYTTDDNGDLIYRDNYQEIFNNLYEEYYNFLTDEQI